MSRNKKSLGVISTLLTIILAIAMLVWIVFPAGKVAYAAFFGFEQKYIKSFEKFVDGINRMTADRQQSSVKLGKESAIIGFSRKADSYECYNCDVGIVNPRATIIVEKPNKQECISKACICLCTRGFELEGNEPKKGKCKKEWDCRELEKDDIEEKTIIKFYSGSGGTEHWNKGFLFARGISGANGLKKYDEETAYLYVEKKCIYGPVQEGESQCFIGVCNEDILEVHNKILEKKGIGEDDPRFNSCIITI